MVGELRKREIGFTSLHERLDTITSGGGGVFHVFAALAKSIQELIVSGTRERLDASRGRIDGTPTVVNDDILHAARDLLPKHSITSTTKLLGPALAGSTTASPSLREQRAGRSALEVDSRCPPSPSLSRTASLRPQQAAPRPSRA
ncbi:hypothetical protein [Streptomyces prunicolor]|uniref:hypothetical protein n=1 Tax=Streptomyces prunicolor TaxID=67348 RepID=UPI00037D7841|nr:hypothetical protein [Streptomyces prunicolor]